MKGDYRDFEVSRFSAFRCDSDKGQKNKRIRPSKNTRQQTLGMFSTKLHEAMQNYTIPITDTILNDIYSTTLHADPNLR